MGYTMKNKLITGILFFTLVLSLAEGLPAKPVASAASKETIASLDYNYASTGDMETASDPTLNKTKYGSKTDGYRFTIGSATLYASINGSEGRKLEWSKDLYTCPDNGGKIKEPVMTAGKNFPWKKDTVPYFEVHVSTKGYTETTFSAYVGATKKGPKCYRLSYAVGNSTTFKAISGTNISLSDNKAMQKINGTLPSETDDQSLVKIRVEICSMETCGGSYLYNDTTGGEAAINHIMIQASKAEVKPSPSPSKSDSSAQNNTTKNNSQSQTATATKINVKKLTLKKTKLSLKKGKTYKLKYKLTVKPNTTENVSTVKAKLKWSSSDKTIVSVSKKGVVKAKKKGKAVITLKYSKKIKATCKVTVK